MHRPRTARTELSLELENKYPKMHLEIDHLKNPDINLRAPICQHKFSAPNKSEFASNLFLDVWNLFCGALELRDAHGFSRNFPSTAVKFQLAAKLEAVFGKTSFQRKNHC